ncbi:MAG: MoaD/ThiS family protein [Desulfatiglandaceae bacterium]|jgi:molybdopterin converting factor small subunit
MNLTISVFGRDIILKQETILELASPTLIGVTRALLEQNRAEWDRIVQDDFTPSEGYEVLVNGRNIKSLEGLDTRIHEGDEILFTVPLVGG